MNDDVCSPEGYCNILKSVSIPYHDKMHKGIGIVELCDHDTGKSSGTYVGYQANSKEKLIIFAYCPFCGFDFTSCVMKKND